MNPDDLLAGFQAHLKQQAQQKQSDYDMNQPSDHSTLGNLGRGAANGMAQGTLSTMGTVGHLLTKLGANNVGPAISQYADDQKTTAQDFYDPHGTAGRIGTYAGQAVDNTAQFMAGGEMLGGAKVAGGLAKAAPRFFGGAAGQAAAAALPGSAVHALASKYGDPSGESTFFGTLARDEGGAAMVGGAAGLVGKLGRGLGAIGQRLMGKAAGSDAGALSQGLEDAHVSAPTEAPTPLAPQSSAPAAPAPAAHAPPEAPIAPVEAKPPANMASQEAPAPQPAAPTESPTPPAKVQPKKVAPKPAAKAAATDAPADAPPKTGSQKGGKAKPAAPPKAADSNSGAKPGNQWTTKDAQTAYSHEEYLNETAPRMLKGLSEGSPMHTKLLAQMERTKGDLAALNARRPKK